MTNAPSENSTSTMKPDDYKKILLSKGFVLLRSQPAWTQHRGDEYVYTHPNYKFQFYVKRTSDLDGAPWGFNPQFVNGATFENLAPSNAVDIFRNKNTPMWVDEAFIELMEYV